MNCGRGEAGLGIAERRDAWHARAAAAPPPEGVEIKPLTVRGVPQGVEVTLTSAREAPHAWYGMAAASPVATRHLAFGLRWLGATA